MNYVSLFKKGRWLSRSNSILSDKKKMTQMLAKLTRYTSKEGLKEVKAQLLLIWQYLRDVLSGNYKDYNASSLTLAVAAILYVVSPLDILPDFLPAGLVDDVAIVSWACVKLNEELAKYKRQLPGAAASTAATSTGAS